MKLTKNRDILKVKYTGCLVNGKFEGRGILKHAQNDQIFYEGKFRAGDIFGAIYDLYYKEDSKMLEIICENDCELSKANGDVQFFHTNGQLALKGKVRKGLIDGECKEYHVNGKLRYDGRFKQGGYEGCDLEVFHNYPVVSAQTEKDYPLGQTPKNLILKANFEKGLLQGKVDKIFLQKNVLPGGNTFAMVENAFYIDNKLDTKDGIKPDVKIRSPIQDIFYEGQYKDGLKHGMGKLKCAASGLTLFSGEWKDDLPSRNDDSELLNRVVFYHRIFGKRIFQGTLNRRPDGKIGGKCKLFYFMNGEDCFYEGNYSAPS